MPFSYRYKIMPLSPAFSMSVSSFLFSDIGSPPSKRRKQDYEAQPIIGGTNSTQSRSARVRSANLPQEYELARLIRDMEGTHPSWTIETPACDWDGVTCDDKGEVNEVNWHHKVVTGTIHLSYLPSHVTLFSVAQDKEAKGCTGEVSWEELPSKLEYLCLSGNQFSGAVDLTVLPDTLQSLYLNKNKFSGSISLTHLHATMRTLTLDHNALDGSLDLTSLPESMTYLTLNHNKFTGSICLDLLPPKMNSLYLNCNALSGTLGLNKLRERSLVLLHLHDNKFSGNVDLSHLPFQLKYFTVANNQDLCGEVKKTSLRFKVGKESCVEGTEIKIID